MGILDRLFFWRRDESADHEVDGCFTLPGAELDRDEACAAPDLDETAESGT